MLPAASVARTEKVCEPSVSAASVSGEVHDPNEPLSTLHSNVEPVSLEENSNVGVLSLVAPDGPAVIDVSGAAVSTVIVRVAGEASVLPEASVAHTLKVYSVAAVRPP